MLPFTSQKLSEECFSEPECEEVCTPVTARFCFPHVLRIEKLSVDRSPHVSNCTVVEEEQCRTFEEMQCATVLVRKTK